MLQIHSSTAPLQSYNHIHKGNLHPWGPKPTIEIINPLLSFSLILLKCYILKLANSKNSAAEYAQNLMYSNLVIYSFLKLNGICKLVVASSNFQMSFDLVANFWTPLNIQLWPPMSFVLVKIFIQLQFCPLSVHLRCQGFWLSWNS